MDKLSMKQEISFPFICLSVRPFVRWPVACLAGCSGNEFQNFALRLTSSAERQTTKTRTMNESRALSALVCVCARARQKVHNSTRLSAFGFHWPELS